MIVDFKYHMASLVAVFLALGLGIFMGSTVLGESLVGNLVEEQEHIVRRLEADYEVLKEELKISRQEIKKQKEINDAYQRYAEETLPFMLKDKLKGRRVAVIEHTMLEKTQVSLFTKGLELAGAQLFFNFSLSDDFNLLREACNIDTVVVLGEKKADLELLSRIKGCNIAVYTLETENKKTSYDHIPSLVSLILSIAQGE